MKTKLYYFFIFFTVILSCNDNSEEINTTLPNGIVITTSNKNIETGEINLIATQTSGNQTGNWSIISENDIQGSFSVPSNSVTKFTGSILEEYEIQWTISNGNTSISNSIEIRLFENQSLDELIANERDVNKLINLYEKEYFSLIELKKAGISIIELYDNDISVLELINIFGIANVYNSGVTIENMIVPGFGLKNAFNLIADNWRELSSPSFEIYDIFENEGFFVIDLLNAGIDSSILYSRGASLTDLLDAEIPLKTFLGTSWQTSKEILILESITLETLIAEEIVIETPISGLYLLVYNCKGISDAFFNPDCSTFYNELNRLYPNTNQWRRPSFEELNLIKEQNINFYENYIEEEIEFHYLSTSNVNNQSCPQWYETQDGGRLVSFCNGQEGISASVYSLAYMGFINL